MEGLAMGSYGAYVWTCFGLTAAVLLINEWRIRVRQATVTYTRSERRRAAKTRQKAQRKTNVGALDRLADGADECA